MIDKVAVIGLGQLGSRHLQAISKAQGVSTIYLVDPSEHSLKTAIERYKQVAEITDQKLIPLTDINDIPIEIDFCVVATNSLIRRNVLEKLFFDRVVKYLLIEKFLFPKIEDYNIIGNLIKQNNSKAWVNCPRRMYSYYKTIKKDIKIDDNVLMSVTSSDIFIGTNAIHFLDLYSYLTNNETNFSIDLSGLEKKIYQSKRPGYIEFKGRMIVSSSMHTLIFQSFKTPGMPLEVSIITDGSRYSIMENNGLLCTSSIESQWRWSKQSVKTPFQSELTNLVIDQINNTGNCELTSYDESSFLHKKLLESLLHFMNNELKIDTDICAIT